MHTSSRTVRRGLLVLAWLSCIMLASAAAPIISVTLTDNTSTAVGPGDTVSYTAVVANTGDAAATAVTFSDTVDQNTTIVGGSVKVTPIALPDAYPNVIGNTRWTADAASGLLANDTDPDATPALSNTGLTVKAGSVNRTGGTLTGTLVVAADGSFTYDPPAGATGDETFSYVVTDTDAQDSVNPGTVTFTVSNRVWYVDINASVNGNGTSQSPFDSLAPVNGAGGAGDADAAGDIIDVRRGDGATTPYTSGFIFEDNQQLYGSGATLTVNGQTIHGAVDYSYLDSAGDNLQLASNNTVRGCYLYGAGNANAAIVSSAAFGTFTFSDGGINGEGRLLDLQHTGTLAATFGELVTTSFSGGPAINLDGVGGTLLVTGGVTSITSGPSGISVQNVPAGASLNFGNTGVVVTGDGVLLSSNSGTSTTTFTRLIVGTTASGRGLQCQNAGSVVVGGTSNSLTAVGEAALWCSTVNLSNGSGQPAVFDSLESTNSTGLGVLLSGLQGSGLTVTGQTTVTNPTNVGLSIGTASAPYHFGDVLINQRNTNGMTIVSGSSQDGQFGNVTINNQNSSATPGCMINNLTSGTVTFTSLTVANNGANALGLTLANNDATINVQGGSISGAGDSAFSATSGGGQLTYAGSITNTAGRSVNIANNENGGVITLSGTITDSGTGILVDNNDQSGGNATVNFTGQVNLTTGTNAAFTASNGGVVTVQGANNTLTTTTGTALNVANTSIGAAGLTFKSIASNGGTNTGIILDTTGSSGSLAVTGTGGAGTGGTIQNKTGADGSKSTGCGIYLNNTTHPSLSWMQLNGFQNFAIRGFAVNGLTMNQVVINGTNGNSATENEGSVSFGAGTGAPDGPTTGLIGSASVTNCNISGGFEDNFRVYNTSGTLNRLTFDATTIGANSTSDGNDGLLCETESSAVINLTVQNSVFTSARGDLFQFTNNGTGACDLIFSTNQLSNNHAAIATGGGGVTIGTNGGGNLTYSLTGSTFRDAVGHALLLVHAGGAASMTGTVSGNTIGTAAANSGSLEGDAVKAQLVGGNGTFKLTFAGNQVKEYNNFGLDLLCGGGAVATGGTYSVIATGNTIGPIGSNTAAAQLQGIGLNAGTIPGDTFQVYLQLGGTNTDSNTVSNWTAANGLQDIRLRQRQSTTVHLSAKDGAGSISYSGTSSDTAAVKTFIETYNSTSGNNSAAVSGSGGGFVGGAPPLSAFGGPAPRAVSARLTAREPDAVLNAALQRWPESAPVVTVVTELPGERLAQQLAGRIELDPTAAGYGWFVDATPADDHEFALLRRLAADPTHWFGLELPTRPAFELVAEPGSPAYGKMDLLTALLHELGHAGGLDHTSPPELMAAELPVGVRRLPPGIAPQLGVARAAGTSLAAILPPRGLAPAAPEPAPEKSLLEVAADWLRPAWERVASLPSALGSRRRAMPQVGGRPKLTPVDVVVSGSPNNLAVDLGTLPPGQSVRINWNVAVADPLNTPASTLTTQASVSGGGFATVTSDDPDTGAAGDATVTAVNLQADLSITKTDGVASEVPGTAVTYTIVASNAGPHTVTGATVTDTFPVAISGVTWTAVGAGGATVGGSGAGNLSEPVNLPAGGSATFTVTGTIDPSATANLSNTATISAPGGVTDPLPGNNSASDIDTLTPQADLAVTQSDSPDPVKAGENLTYTIDVTQNGPSDAASVSVTDAIPANTTFVSAGVISGSGWASSTPAVGATGNVVFSRATWAAGGTAQFQVVVKVDPTTTTGTVISNTATAATTSTDPTPGNDSATATSTVQRSIDLALSETLPATVVAGSAGGADNLTGAIVVTNHGPSQASGISVLIDTHAPLPAGVTLSGTTNPTQGTFTPGTGVWSVGDLAAGASVQLNLAFNVAPSAATGATIQIDAAVSAANETDANNANDAAGQTVTVQREVDLAVTGTDTPDPVGAGGNITYRITLANTGPSNAAGAQLIQAVAPNTGFVSAQVITGAGWSITSPAVGATGTVTFAKVSIDATETAEFEVVVKVDDNLANGSQILAKASATSNETDTNSGNDSHNFVTDVTASADLTVTKTDSPDPVNAGAHLTYTVNFQNNGPQNAQSVTVTDAVPANCSFVSAAVTGGSGWTITAPTVGDSGNVVFSKATVANAETATITIVVKVASSTANATVISNTATAATTTPDPSAGNDSATATTTVALSADLAVSKVDSPDPVTAGQTLAYTIDYVNNGPSDAATVSVQDTLPAGLDFVSATAPGGWSTSAPPAGAGGTVTFSKAAVAAGETGQFVITVQVDPATANGTVIDNTATISATTPDPTGGNDSATASTTVATVADLVLTKLDAPDPVAAGTNLTYTLDLVNNGPSNAATVTVTDAVPAGTTFVSASLLAGAGWTSSLPAVGAMGNVVFSKAAVAASETAQFQVVVNVADTRTTAIDNTAVVATTSTDPIPGDNTATQNTTVATLTDLALSGGASPDPVTAGETLTFTVNLTNNGPSAAQNAMVSHTLPADTTFLAATVTSGSGWTPTTPAVGATGTVDFAKATVGAGETASFAIQLRVAPSAADGSQIKPKATAATSTSDSNNANDTAGGAAFVAAASDLTVTKSATPNPIASGTDLTYTIGYTNLGPSDGQSIGISDPLPANTTFVSATVSSGSGWSLVTPAVGATGTVLISKANSPVGDTASFTIVLHVDAGAPNGTVISNTATVSTAGNDPNAANNAATANVTVQPRADLVLTVTDSPDPIAAGANLTCTATLTNHGPSDAANVIFTDVLPTQVAFVSQSQTAGPAFTLTEAGGTISNTIATLKSGETATFAIVVRAQTAGTALHTPTAVSDAPDATPGDAAVAVSTTINPGAIDPAASLVSVDKTTAIANDIDTVTITITARDAYGNPVPGATASDFQVTGAPNNGLTLTQPTGTTGSDGKTTATARRTAAGQTDFTATHGGTPLHNGVSVDWQPGQPDGTRSRLTASPTSAIADGTSNTVFVAELLDVNGNPVPSYEAGKLQFYAVSGGGGGSISQPATNTDLAGKTSGSATSTVAGPVEYGLKVNGTAIAATVTVNYVPGAANAGRSTATVPNGTVGDATAITIVLRDAHGNRRTTGGDAVAVSITGANTATPTVTDHGDGSFTASYVPTHAGTDQVAITLGGVAISGSPYSSVVSPAATHAPSSTATVPNGTVGEATQLTVIARDVYGNRRPTGGDAVAVAVTGANTATPTVTDRGDGRYTASYVPTHAGTDQVAITIGGVGISGNPFSSVVSPAGSHAPSSTANVPNGTVGEATQLTVIARDVYGNRRPVGGDAVTIAVSGANTATPTVTDRGDGSYTASYVPTLAGTDQVMILLGGVAISGSPLSSAVAPAGTYAPSSTATVPNGTVGEAIQLTVIARDVYGNRRPTGGDIVLVTITGANTATPTVTDQGDGSYTASYVPTAAGTDHAVITIGGVTISGSPFSSTVASAGTYAPSSTATVPNGTVGEATQLTVIARDVYGNRRPTGGDTVTIAITGANSATPTVTDRGDGSYTASYVPTVAGTDHAAITIGGVPISGSPFTSQVAPAASHAASSTATVPNGSAGQPTLITVVARDVYGNRRPTGGDSVVVLVSGANTASPTVTDHGDGRYTASYTPTAAGLDQVAITLGGAALGGSPFASAVSPASPDATQSSLTAAPGSAAADGLERITATLTVRDAFGNPIADIAPAELILSGAPTGLTIGAPTATDASGSTTFAISSTSRGRFTLSASARGVALGSVEVSFRARYATTLPAGVRFFALPYLADNPRPEALLGEPSNWRLKRWDPAIGDYREYRLGDDPSFFEFRPGRGVFVKLTAPVTIHPLGEPVPAGPFTVPLGQGWNNAGNPFGSDLFWDPSTVQVLIAGAPVGTLADSSLWDRVRPYVWVYDPATDTNRLVYPGLSLDRVPREAGFWALSEAPDVELRFNPPAAGRSVSAPPSVRDWKVELLASASGRSATALVGVTAGSSRALSIDAPPEVASAPFRIDILSDGRRLAGELRPGDGREQTWELEVVGGGEVSLSWPSLLRSLPRGVVVELNDLETGQTRVLNTRSSYAWHSETGRRRLRLTARVGNLERATITGLSVQGTRGSGQAVTLTLTAPAEVALTVKGLGGQLVKRVDAGTVPAGTTTVSWDGTDDSGRRVPRGTYLLEATATSPNGALSRVVRTVMVR